MNASWQDYMVAIFEINEVGNMATNKLISEKLGISPPSVTDMIKKLKNGGVVYVEKGIVSLTEYGYEETKKLISKHRLWECFLGTKLNYSWVDVHDESKELQYITSDNLMNKLNEFLDYPVCCPHGGRIYINSGDEKTNFLCIDDIKIGNKIRIERFSDDKNLLDYMDRKKVKLGDVLEVIDIDNFDNSIYFKSSNGEDVNIGSKALGSIFISLQKQNK